MKFLGEINSEFLRVDAAVPGRDSNFLQNIQLLLSPLTDSGIYSKEALILNYELCLKIYKLGLDPEGLKAFP
jgi:hypothetical protein